MERQELILKWGTIKGWSGCDEGTPFRKALSDYWDISGQSMSAMTQENTQRHKDALCAVVDAVCDAGGIVWNDWDGVEMDRDGAKKYIQSYGRN